MAASDTIVAAVPTDAEEGPLLLGAGIEAPSHAGAGAGDARGSSNGDPHMRHGGGGPCEDTMSFTKVHAGQGICATDAGCRPGIANTAPQWPQRKRVPGGVPAGIDTPLPHWQRNTDGNCSTACCCARCRAWAAR